VGRPSHVTAEPVLAYGSRVLPADSRAAQRTATRIERVERAVDGGVPVAVLRWPEERALADQLVADELPRLLLLEPLTMPVVALGSLEDWVRLPVSVLDQRTRLRRLRTAGCESRPGVTALVGRRRLTLDALQPAAGDSAG
jgi:hypothetical protein